MQLLSMFLVLATLLDKQGFMMKKQQTNEKQKADKIKVKYI